MEHCTIRICLRGLDTKKIGVGVYESFEMWCWRRMEKVKWSEKETNEEVLEHIGEKRTLIF